VAGKHGALVDAMIVANIDPLKRRVNLVSVPRDLFYNNRKINEIYSLYGMEELKRTLAFITGYHIDGICHMFYVATWKNYCPLRI